MPIVPFAREDLVATAWKNGGGRTREIVRVPAGSSMDTFDWRASIAEITAGGPFSTFAGCDRVLVLLSGDGVHLRSTDANIGHRLSEPLTPFAFAGESQIEASLIGGASSDFNVMTRRATTHADVQVVVSNQTLPACSAGVLFAARGQWDVRSFEDDSRAFRLEANTGLWWSGESSAWKLMPRMPTARMIAVGVTASPSSRHSA